MTSAAEAMKNLNQPKISTPICVILCMIFFIIGNLSRNVLTDTIILFSADNQRKCDLGICVGDRKSDVITDMKSLNIEYSTVSVLCQESGVIHYSRFMMPLESEWNCIRSEIILANRTSRWILSFERDILIGIRRQSYIDPVI